MNELPGIRVLIAEDHEDVAGMLALVLESAGADEIHIASDGLEAERVYDSLQEAGRPPDVLIVDAAMPVEDGFSFAEHVRRARADRVTPILLLTGQSEMLMEAHAKHSGINEVIYKPCEPLQIVETIERLLAKKE